MNNLTRRTFMTRGSVGVAFAAAIAAIPGAASVLRHSTPSIPNLTAASDEPLIAHVRDLNSGEIALLIGTREVVYKDVELAGRLYAAAQRAR